MPWKETCAVNERISFINDWLTHKVPVAQLCRMYDISRTIGYKWIKRFKTGGYEALHDHSRAPKRQASATDESLVHEIIAFRTLHPTWGPKKIKAALEQQLPDLQLPAASTIGDLLKKAGLVKPRRRRRRIVGGDGSTAAASQANDLWNADFKGQFKLGNGQYCYPLTVTDAYSRALLCCEALPSTRGSGVHASFERLFKEFGLPSAIRTDNGAPFASSGAGRLSKVNVVWLRLGIQPVRIAPGKPQQNGSHERMHRTLKAETTRPPKSSLGGQQACFDGFRREYNEVRPHEALGQATPSSKYQASPREYPNELPEPEYPSHWEVRRVKRNGYVKFAGLDFFVSEALGRELVGLVEVDDGVWRLEFCGYPVASIDLREKQLWALGGVEADRRRGSRYKR